MVNKLLHHPFISFDSRRLPTADARVRARVVWDLWWTKFSQSTTVSPTNSHSTYCSTLIIYHPGLVNRSNSGCSTKWTQSHTVRDTR
jgi:hypothetical protein